MVADQGIRKEMVCGDGLINLQEGIQRICNGEDCLMWQGASGKGCDLQHADEDLRKRCLMKNDILKKTGYATEQKFSQSILLQSLNYYHTSRCVGYKLNLIRFMNIISAKITKHKKRKWDMLF